jgi:mannose-6-phosphate isomerase
MPPVKPCLLERTVQARIWGGHGLRDLFGIGSDDGSPIGETWELFDRPGSSSRIRGGGTLAELMRKDARAVLGARTRPGHGGHFPLVFKFLDAQTALSVQVHPDDAQAAAEHDGGKSEAWLVLRSSPGARVVRGFKPGVTREQFTGAVGKAAIEPLLFSFRPDVGDLIHVPANTVHAVGGGAVIFEVQQNSDITYRIWDWGRERRLHLDRAVAVARVEDGSRQPTVPPRPLPDGSTLLVQTAFFRVRRLQGSRPVALPTGGAFAVVTVLGGRGRLKWHGDAGESLPLRPGDCALVPACIAELSLSPEGSLDVALTDPGLTDPGQN